MESVGIYSQFPFCASKCSFCNFGTRVARAELLARYVEALEREIGGLREIYRTRCLRSRVLALPVDTVYIGGGTPSLLAEKQFERVCGALARRFDFEHWREFTVEVTPGSGDKCFLQRARSLGANRLSIGALPGRESRHSLKYWQLQPYVGLAAGAHSFDGEYRWANETSPEAYMEKLARAEAPLAQIHRLTPEEQIGQFFSLGLRQCTGIDPSEARRRSGKGHLAAWEQKVEGLARDGWLVRDCTWVRLTERAYLYRTKPFRSFSSRFHWQEYQWRRRSR